MNLTLELTTEQIIDLVKKSNVLSGISKLLRQNASYQSLFSTNLLKEEYAKIS